MSRPRRNLFVYGTLRQGFGHPLFRLLSRHSRALGPATVPGVLYDLGSYPGLIREAGLVHGEVFELFAPDRVLPELDRYEECGPGFARPWEYRRELWPVEMSDGRKLRAFVYVYMWNKKNAVRISHGDYIKYLEP